MKTERSLYTIGILLLPLMLILLNQGCFFFKKKPIEIDTGTQEVQQQEGSLPATEESKAGEPSTKTVVMVAEDEMDPGEFDELLDELNEMEKLHAELRAELDEMEKRRDELNEGDKLLTKSAELDDKIEKLRNKLNEREKLRAELNEMIETLRNEPNKGEMKQLIAELEPVKLNLWTFNNPNDSFPVSLAISETDLVVGDAVTLEMHISTDAHLVLLNWSGAGEMQQLIPNDFLPTSWWKAGQHSFPGGDADFEIRVDTPGTERLKLLAFQNAEDSRAVANIFQTEAVTAEEKILEYLQSMNSTDWAEAQLEVSVREPERPVPDRELLNVNAENIVYIKHGDDMYLARRLETRYGEAGTTVVHIFNAELREELGDTIAAELVLGRRTEPAQGWGNRRVMLSFYRDGEWSFTTDVVVFETYYELPERIDGKRVRDSRIVGFGEVRFPIPVSFQ